MPESVPGGTNATQTKGRQKDGQVSMWIAIISALGAIAAAIVAGWQAQQVSQQNILSVQQQLLQLTTSIAQQYDQRTSIMNQAAGSLSGSARTSALSAASIAWTDHLLADGEAGVVLISYLQGKGDVAAIEYTEVADALITGDDFSQAIEYYHDAVNALPREPLTQIDALRSEGAAYYKLSETASGHALIMQSVGITKRITLPRGTLAHFLGQAFLQDAWYEMRAGNCKIGLAEMAEGIGSLASVKPGNSTDQLWVASDNAAVKQYCR